MLKIPVAAIDKLSEWAGKLFSFMVLPIIVIQAVEVIRRYVFDSPTIWAWEAVSLMGGSMLVMVTAWVLLEDRHVRTDLIYGKLSRKWQALIDLFFFILLFLPFVTILSYKGVLRAMFSLKIQEATHSMWAPPLYPLKIIIAVSFILLGLQGLSKIIKDLHYLIKGEEL